MTDRRITKGNKMTEKTDNELTFESFAASDNFSQLIQEECDSAAKTLLQESEELTEDDVNQFGDTFEAAVRSSMKRLIEEEINPHYEEQLQLMVEDVSDDLSQKLNDYMDYVVEEFLEEEKENIVQTETSKQDRMIVEGLVDLLKDNYVEVPEERKDLVEELTDELKESRTEVEDLEEELIELRRKVKGARCERVFQELSEGLADSQVEKFMELVEDISINSPEEFERKATNIRKNFFNSKELEEEESEGDEVLEEEYSEGDPSTSPDDPIAQAVRLGSASKRSAFGKYK